MARSLTTSPFHTAPARGFMIGTRPAPGQQINHHRIDSQENGNGEGGEKEPAVEMLPTLPKRAAPALAYRRALQGVPEYGGADEDVLKNRFLFPRPARRNHGASLCGEPAQSRDEHLAAKNDKNDPERQSPDDRQLVLGSRTVRDQIKRKERTNQEQLVGQRIHELAKVRDPAVFARQIPVTKI